MPKKQQKYKVILADPPWDYHNQGNGGAKGHYPPMTAAQILALPVWRFAEDNSVLVLKAVWPFLPVALKVAETWGFKYVSAIPFILTQDWAVVTHTGEEWDIEVKPSYGVGQWVRSCSGVFLLCRRGRVKPPGGDMLGLISKRLRHSKSPESIYEYCEQMEGPRLELFAREKRAGWDVWGNEVESDIDPYQDILISEVFTAKAEVDVTLQGIREAWLESETAFWKIGDGIIALLRTGMTPMAAYQAAGSTVGKSTRWMLEMAKVAHMFPPNKRDPMKPWSWYREQYIMARRYKNSLELQPGTGDQGTDDYLISTGGEFTEPA